MNLIAAIYILVALAIGVYLENLFHSGELEKRANEEEFIKDAGRFIEFNWESHDFRMLVHGIIFFVSLFWLPALIYNTLSSIMKKSDSD